MIRENGVGQFAGYLVYRVGRSFENDSAGSFDATLNLNELSTLFSIPVQTEHKLICNDFRSIVSPLSLFLSTCVWIYSTELCINHIRLRITENRGLSYPGQCSLLGHYQRLEDNAENRFLFCMYACKCVSAPLEIKSTMGISAFTK